VRRILWDLTRAVGAEADGIEAAVDGLGDVDLVRAKARMSNAFAMCEPELTDGRSLELREARHPLLLWLTRPDEPKAPDREDLNFDSVVPLDVRLGDDFDVLMITGPNTGGKTVVLKTMGLACLMARSGMHVAAEHATVPLFDAVFADIGDEQSLEQSLSTFSSHMSRIIRILEEATPHTLVLLDELGAGTDPAEGAALGEAILRRIVQIGCCAALVTHLGRLKTFATSRPQVENASMEFNTRTLRPTYRFRIGSPGSSNALEIADRLGLPVDILAEARDLLDTEAQGEYSAMLDEVQQAREEAEERRDRMQYLEEQAEKMKEQYEEVLARLQAEEDRRGADIGFQMRDKLEEMIREADRLQQDMDDVHKAWARRVRSVRDGLRKCVEDIDALLEGHELERPLEEGDEVYVIKLHKWGTVRRVDERRGRAKVQVGKMSVDIELDELQPWGEELG
jgi:DNA mismatch repair protein MutS2